MAGRTSTRRRRSWGRKIASLVSALSPGRCIAFGFGILMLAMQGARRVSRVKADGFWIIVGIALLMGGLWELWGAAIPLLPVVLIAAGIGQLVCCRD
jgi:hypothetical protein